MAHLVINWVGNTYMNSEVSKVGNEALLDNLKEGVVIMDQDNGTVMFLNEAAKRFNIRTDTPPDISQTKNADIESQFFELQHEKFAYIDKNLLKAANLDSK